MEAYPETVTVSGAGTAEANGVYVYRPDGETKRVVRGIRCVRGIYEHTTNDACWLGFQDCAAFGHPEWNKWMLYGARGILYAAHMDGQLGVPPRKGRWEMASWAGKKQNVGADPPPLVGHGSTVPHDVVSDKDVRLVTTTDASRVGSFKLVLATEPSRALAKDHQYDINDKHNMYGASTKLTDLHAAATFCFASNHKCVSLEADRYLGIAVNCLQYVEGGSCCLLRQKNAYPGNSGAHWKINADGTLSPMMNEDLVLGFGPITYDSWNGREQTADSRGGANWVALGLVSPTSAQRLVVHSTGTTAPDDKTATTQPSAMSMEREPASEKEPEKEPHVISAKSLHGCSCDMGVPISGLPFLPGFSCIYPHPSAPDSEDVFARWAVRLCIPTINEKWERVERANRFVRKEGGMAHVCQEPCKEPLIAHEVTRCCGCCLFHCYFPSPTGFDLGLQPTCFHGILWCWKEGAYTKARLEEFATAHKRWNGGTPHNYGGHHEPHNHMAHSMYNPAPSNDGWTGQYGQ